MGDHRTVRVDVDAAHTAADIVAGARRASRDLLRERAGPRLIESLKRPTYFGPERAMALDSILRNYLPFHT